MRRRSKGPGKQSAREARPAAAPPEEAALDVDEARGGGSPAQPLEDYRVPRAAPEPVAARRRGRDRAARPPGAGGRTGPAPLDVAAQQYGHLPRDLIRIAIIALVMFGVIVALALVIR